MAPSSNPKQSSSGKKVKAAPVAAKSAVGAPSQYSQTNRKGKKNWRKNIDLVKEEEGLEQARAEERLTGGNLSTKSNDQLFFVDTVGDVDVAKKIAKRQVKKPLRSQQILLERSAVPALSSRSITPKTKKTSKVSHEDKARLLRIARKGRVAYDGTGIGSAVVNKESVKAENLKDVWNGQEGSNEGDIDDQDAETEEWLEGGKPPPPPKAPLTIQRQREISVRLAQEKGLPIPSAGISYNPKEEAYQALLDAAVEEEKEALKREEHEQAKIMKRGKVELHGNGEWEVGVANGMKVADGDAEALREEREADEERTRLEGDVDEEEEEEVKKKKEIKRKTQSDRNKAKRLAEAKQALRQADARKATRKSLSSLSTLQKDVESTNVARGKANDARRKARFDREHGGKEEGQKVGKHKVKGERVDVQLGEDLSENLRGLKPEGNLFRDRFLALQHRALLEPRVPRMPKKRTLKLKEYEKFPWKHFERS